MIADNRLFGDRSRVAAERMRKGEWFSSDKLVALDFLRRFNALGAAGDRHLVEFVPWYLTSERELHRWGVVVTPYAWRLARSRQKRRSTTFNRDTLNPSGEEGVAQICALLGVMPLDSNVNLPNRGQMTDMPQGAVVETYAQFRRGMVTPVVARPLPTGVAELVRRVIAVQQMTLTAAIKCDRELAFQAMLNDPLVSIPTDRAWRMFCEMVRFTKKMLPRW